MPSSLESRDIVVVLPLPAGPLRSSSLLRALPLKTSLSHVRTSATFFLCTASSSSDAGPYFSVHGRRSTTSWCAGWDDDNGGGVLRAPVAVRRNFCLPAALLPWPVGAVAAIGLLRTGRGFGGLVGRTSSSSSMSESTMSSTCSAEAAYFSGLGVGCADSERGTLLKNEVMGLYVGFGLAGELAGAFLVGDVLVVVGLEGLGEAARAWDRVGLSGSRGPVEVAVSVAALLERSGGGESASRPSDSSSDSNTSGFFRGARNLAMSARGGGCEAVSAAQ